MTNFDKQDILKQRFLEVAEIVNLEKGYIKVVDFNLALDPDIIDLASKIWAEQYQHRTDIEAIVGLPDAGSRLVSIVADKIRIPRILPSKRVEEPPAAWEDTVSFVNSSFTQGKDLVSQIGFVKPGKNILLVDDVVAHGSTAIAAISALQQAGVKVVGLMVLFDKVWQGGVAEIEKETGVPVFSIVRVAELTPEGTIRLE